MARFNRVMQLLSFKTLNIPSWDELYFNPGGENVTFLSFLVKL